MKLVLPYLAVTANWWRAALTAVSKQVLIALSAVLRVLFHYVLLPQQGVFAVMAVETLVGGHCCLLFLAAGQREQEEENWTIRQNRKDEKYPVIVQAISSPLSSRKWRCWAIFPLLFKRMWKKSSVVLKTSLPQLIWSEDEAEAGGYGERAVQAQGWGRDEKGWGRIRGIHWGGSSINTGPLISGNLWGEWTCSTASFCTF